MKLTVTQADWDKAKAVVNAIKDKKSDAEYRCNCVLAQALRREKKKKVKGVYLCSLELCNARYIMSYQAEKIREAFDCGREITLPQTVELTKTNY